MVDKAFDPSSFSLAFGMEWYHVSQVVDRPTFSRKRWCHVSVVMNEPMASPKPLGLPASFSTYRKVLGPSFPLS